MKNLSETQKAYIAGFIDGEGCITISRNKSKSKAWEFDFHPRILVTNSDIDVIFFLHDLTGIGCVYRYEKAWQSKWKPIHRWQISTNEAINLINAIMPYLHIKKEVAELVLSFPFHKYGGVSRTIELYKEQVLVHAKVTEKNKRGI